MKRKTKVRNIVTAFSVLIVLIVLGVYMLQKNSDTVETKPAINEKYTLSLLPEADEESNFWELILVNHNYSIPENYDFDLAELDGGIQIDSRIYPYLQAMINDMRRNDIYAVVAEGYRTAQDQEQIILDKIDAYMYEGYTYEDAKIAASMVAAEVGKSEHQLGLAADINADTRFSTDEEVYNWLAENSYKYGFILRYPADKTDITGISYEPWHYRFVGLKAAKEIYEQRICLEEYLD